MPAKGMHYLTERQVHDQISDIVDPRENVWRHENFLTLKKKIVGIYLVSYLSP